MSAPNQATLKMLELRRQETDVMVALVNAGEALKDAAAWYLEEGSDEAREALAGAASAWETL